MTPSPAPAPDGRLRRLLGAAARPGPVRAGPPDRLRPEAAWDDAHDAGWSEMGCETSWETMR